MVTLHFSWDQFLAGVTLRTFCFRLKDPIFSIMTPLKSDEFKSTTKKILDIPIGYRKVEILAYPVTG